MKKREVLVEQIAKSGLCAVCKGTKMLCGRSECPLLKRYYALMRVQRRVSKNLVGSSPPEIFVGRYGYPKVSIGPMVPPELGNTEIMGEPERWIDMPFDGFVEMRTSLVRGMMRVSVNEAQDPSYRIFEIQELAMSESHVDSEVLFRRNPRGTIVAGSDVQPYGPKGVIEKFRKDTVRANPRIEKIYYDELPARDSIVELYRSGVSVSSIQRSLSAGLLGEKKKFVPTRWSITAVDDALGLHLLDKIKEFPVMDRAEVYVSKRMENIFTVILLPRAWSYELVEAWYPGTLWNPYGRRVVMVSSHERYWGRKKYAEIGGCYYAARLAVAEKLVEKRRQAMAIVLREAQPSYLMPVGVWQVRENVRAALRGDAHVFDSEDEAINFALSHFHISRRTWLENSALLRDLRVQRRLDDFGLR